MRRRIAWSAGLVFVLVVGGVAYGISSSKAPRFPKQFAELAAGTANVYGVSTERSAVAQAPCEDGTFSGKERVRIAYQACVHPAEKGAIVISSGRTESYLIYRELIDDLRKQGYSVYIHDHRGQGLSQRLLDDPQKSHVAKFDDYVADLHQFVHQVVKPNTHRRLFLVAHSMGGGIASLYIEQYPQDFHAAALVTPMNAPTNPTLGTGLLCAGNRLFPFPTRWARFQKPYDPDFAFAANDLTHSNTRWTRTRRIYNANREASLGGITHGWLRQACDAGVRMRDDANVDRIRIPILLLQAGDDTAVDKEAQEEFCDKVNDGDSGSCEGYVLRGALHALFIESDAFRIPALTKIIEFLDRQAA
jgi:lysophospholipase